MGSNEVQTGAHGKAALPSLDGLRGLACLLVVVSHIGLPSWMPREAFGFTGVALFFVLSGFLMAYLYADRPITRSEASLYAVSRFSRIAPVYWLVITLCILATVLDSSFVFRIDSLAHVVRHYFFIGYVGVFWSIGPEVQYYVFFLFLWFAWQRRVRQPVWLVLALVAALAFFYTRPLWPGVWMPGKFHLFISGSIAGMLPRPSSGSLRTVPLQYLACVLMALPLALSAIYGFGNSDNYAVLLYGPMFGAVVYLLSIQTDWVRNVFGGVFIRKVGKASFSIYLLHVVFIDYFCRAFGMERLGLSLFGIPLACMAVWLSTVFSDQVEMPFQLFVKRRIFSRAGVA